jgi:hypothetical protein
MFAQTQFGSYESEERILRKEAFVPQELVDKLVLTMSYGIDCEVENCNRFLG